MHSERPRAHRYPFVATIEVTHVGTEIQFIGQTIDVSVYGCALNLLSTSKTLPQGTTVRIRILYGGANFAAFGKVVRASASAVIGIAFTQVEASQQATLEKWINQLRYLLLA